MSSPNPNPSITPRPNHPPTPSISSCSTHSLNPNDPRPPSRASHRSDTYPPKFRNSSAFFRPDSRASSQPRANPVFQKHQQQPPPQHDPRASEGSRLGGYHGGYDRLPPSGADAEPSRLPFVEPPMEYDDDQVSDQVSDGGERRNGSRGRQVLRVNLETMPTAAKMGLWLMGTTPRKMAKAARAQQERREREREARRLLRDVRRVEEEGEEQERFRRGNDVTADEKEEWEREFQRLGIRDDDGVALAA